MGLKEQIYLLEIQIHDTHLETVKELECLDNQQDFKIYAHFLSFDPVLVHDNLNDEFKALPILFKMNPDELIKALDRSPLALSVAGMLDETREYTVGTIKILFTEAFVEAITMATASIMFPVIAQIDEPFQFRNLYHEESGYMSVNLKLSCFGDIDIKRLSPCEKEQVNEPVNVVEDNLDANFDGKEFEFSPVITDLEKVTPATTIAANYVGIKQPIPWKMTDDRQLVAPPDISAQNRASLRKSDAQNKPDFTLQCTCEDVPDIFNTKPAQPITLKCQCADILAAMKSCFPDGFPGMDQQQCGGDNMSGIPQPGTGTTTSQPMEYQAPKPSLDPPQRPQVAQPPIQTTGPGDDIVPTSAICGLELKSSGQPFKSASEENVNLPVNKPDLKNAISNVELSSPEAKTEDSTKKINDKNGPNWDERKQAIKKEVKKKNKKVADIYEFTAGMYPGMVIGHKYCIPSVRLVPRNMGWMWNLLDLFGQSKKSKGWRPGAIVKTVANNFGSWNRAAGFKDGDDAETFFNFKRKKGGKEAETFKSPLSVKPTLHVHKKDKFYHITVNPPGESNVKPLTFKVDPRKGSSDEETSSGSTSDDSFEFEYTVPAGLVPPPKKIEWSNDATQYNVQDFSPKKKAEQSATAEEPQKDKNESKKGGKGGKGGKDAKGGKGGKGGKKKGK